MKVKMDLKNSQKNVIKLKPANSNTNVNVNVNVLPLLKKLKNQASGENRRSSSRSIKRKRFDDEIVEFHAGYPSQHGNSSGRAGRYRTQSQTSSPYIPSPTTSGILQLPVAITPPSASQLLVSTSKLPTSTITTASGLSTSILAVPGPILHYQPSSRKRGKKAHGNKKGGRPGHHHITTKDLGRWKPVDDLALIIGVQQTNDLKTVHRGTKFSCKFTLQELQSRWYSLLYEEPISRIAVAAMRNLHPELVENVQSKALYTLQEEDLLGTIKSTETPTVDMFQDMLDKNPAIFYPARTGKSLLNHWHLMKQYSLLPDQTIKALFNDEQPLSFSDAEELIQDADLADSKDEALEVELALADRRSKREIRHLENELGRWNVLVDSMTGCGIPDFDNQTLAVLRGRLVRYLMRSKEITFGRSVKDLTVDVDLSLEGPACKVSRKQGTIKLRSNGDFFISNEGTRAIYIDGMPLLQGNKTRLGTNAVLEIAGLRFVFIVNYDLINAIRHESAKTAGPLN